MLLVKIIEMFNQTISRTPVEDLNFLRSNAFKFTIKDIPYISFTCQEVKIPGISFGQAVQKTPFIDIPRIGDKLSFEPLVLNFIVDENFKNYLEVYRWLIGSGFPEDYDQFRAFADQRQNQFPLIKNSNKYNEYLAYSDGTLSILDSDNNAKVNIIFKDIFPINLTGLSVNIRENDQHYLMGTTIFSYRIFDIEIL